MTPRDLFSLALEALLAHRLRYGLSALAVAVGIAAVVLMVSIGEGTRQFVVDQMSMFGTTLVGVHRGHIETGGMGAGTVGGTRRLTIDDAIALRRLPGVVGGTPFIAGTARVESGERSRSVLLFGAAGEALDAWSMHVASGRGLPAQDWRRGAPLAVVGAKLARELFAGRSPLGEVVRIGKSRYRVVGVLESKGTYLGLDMDDTVMIPTADALRLLNASEISEVNLRAASIDEVDAVAARAKALMLERHGGREDFTIISQKEALKTANGIIDVLTGTVAAIAGISLLVGAIGILTILWIVVRERVQEIGLVRALGANRSQIVAWYLCEAALVSSAGGIAGLVAGVAGAALVGRLVPGLQTATSPGIALLALGVSCAVGLAAGVVPALRAARLDPVEALRSE